MVGYCVRAELYCLVVEKVQAMNLDAFRVMIGLL